MAREGGEGGTAAILLAAGRSRRMDGEDKLWADLGGRPLLAAALARLAAVPGLAAVAVAAPPERREDVAVLAAGLGLGAGAVACVVAGGERRRDSVAAGLRALAGAAPRARWVLVHDAARPLAGPALAARVLAAAREAGAAVPGLPVADTVKEVGDGGLVRRTPDRASLRAIQTPQAFAADLLRRAHAEVEGDAPDDAWLVERLGAPVRVVEGDPLAFKVTTADDLARLRAIVAAGGERGAGGGA